MTIQELQILITAKDQASRVIAQIDRNTRGLGTNFNRFVRPAILSLAAATTALTVVGGFLVRQAMEQEVAMARVQTAMANAGASFEDVGPHVMTTLEALKNFSGFSDTELLNAFLTLLQATGNVDDALAALRITIDLARGSNTDLGKAASDVARGLLGSTRSLKEYGISLDEGATKSDVLAAISEKYGGATARWAGTLEGKLEKLKSRIGDVAQHLAQALLPKAEQAVDIFDQVAQKVEEWVKHNPEVIDFATNVTLVALAATGLAVALGLLASPIATIGLVAAAIYAVWQNIELVRDNWDKFVYALRNGMLNDIPVFGFFFRQASDVLRTIDDIRSTWQGLVNLLSGGLPSQVKAPSVDFGKLVQGAGIGSAIAGPVGGAIGALIGGLRFAQGGIVPGAIGVPRLAVVHGGEEVLRADQRGGGVTVIFQGPVYGMDDFERRVTSAVSRARVAGGFRGVLAGDRR